MTYYTILIRENNTFVRQKGHQLLTKQQGKRSKRN